MGRIGVKYLFIILLFTGFLFGEARLLHSPPRNVRANLPIEIEVLIEGNVVEAKQVRLFYRIAGGDSFVEENLNEYMGVYTGTIPADYVTTEGVEYLIIAEMADGTMAAFPEVDPYDVPMFLAVRKPVDTVEEKQTVSGQNIQEGIRSDIIVLSPEEGAIIAAEEVVLAFSMFNMVNVDMTSIVLTLDGIPVTNQAEINDDLIMYRPQNIKPGLHTARLNMSNQFGDPFATTIVNFTVVKSVEEAQRIFKYSGRVSTEANSTQIQGVRDNINYVRASANGSYDWLSFNAKAFVTSQEDPQRQPRNRMSLSLKTSLFDLAVGDVNPRFSDLSLSGKRVRGVEADLKLKYFNTHIVYGQTERAIEGTISSAPDTLSDGRFQYSRTGYTYDRNLLAIRPYFGSGKNFQLGFSLLKARDDTLSVKREYGGITQNNERSIVMGGVNRPQDNIVLGTDLLLAFDKKRFVWKTDAAFSYLNRDITGGALTLEEMDTFLPGDSLQNDTITLGDMNIPLEGFPDPGDFTKIFIINENISPLMPIVPDTSGKIGMREFLNMPSTAFKTQMKLNYFNNFFVVKYQRVGPEFMSLGNPYMRTDVQGFNISDKIRLFSNRLSVTIAYDQKRDNLLENKESTTTTTSFIANVAIYPGDGLPNISFNTQSYGRQNDLDIQDVSSDTTFTDTSYSVSIKDPRESNVTTRQEFRISHVVRLGDIKNTLNLTYTNSERNDRITDRFPGYQFNKISSSNFSFGVNTVFNFPLTTNLRILSNTTESVTYAHPSKLLSMILQGSYKFFDGKLTTDAGYTMTTSSGLVDFSKHDMFSGVIYRLGEKHQFRGRLRYVYWDYRTTNKAYNDLSFLLNYTFIF